MVSWLELEWQAEAVFDAHADRDSAEHVPGEISGVDAAHEWAFRLDLSAIRPAIPAHPIPECTGPSGGVPCVRR
jgi:hypothetical protein